MAIQETQIIPDSASAIVNEVLQKAKHGGMLQKDVAAEIGVSPQAVTYWKLGTTKPKGDNLLGLIRILRRL